MNAYTIDELDREEIEFLPPRVVMTTSCNNYCPPQPCTPQCGPLVHVTIKVRVGCFLSGRVGLEA